MDSLGVAIIACPCLASGDAELDKDRSLSSVNEPRYQPRDLACFQCSKVNVTIQ